MLSKDFICISYSRLCLVEKFGRAMKINIDLVNVTVELVVAHEAVDCAEASLARLDFNKSRLMYESYSDGSKDIDLVSHEIIAHDTRYRGGLILEKRQR